MNYRLRKKVRRRKYLDTGLFVKWERNENWFRMKDTNLVYRPPIDVSQGDRGWWYIFNSNDRTGDGRGFPNYSIDVSKLFNYKIGNHLDNNTGPYISHLPTSEVISRLLDVVPAELQVKILFNLDLFKDAV